jgi:FixJ family two-component response regulator
MPRERCVHIVDDEVRVREALTVLLSTAGIESRSYGSAEEYLDSTQLTEPACVLLDNQLPGMKGIELLKRIVNATPNSSVIMITGFGDVPTAVLAMKAGAFHFVQKPIDAEALLTSVEEAFSRADKDRDVQSEIAELRGAPQTVRDVVVPISEPVTIVELRESMCRWPIGDPAQSEFRFCGAKKLLGQGPYCACHAGIAYQTQHDRRRERWLQSRPNP